MGEKDGPLVVLLHALGCHSGWWDWVGPELAERYKVIAPDLPGHGDSPVQDDYSYAALAAAVEEVVGVHTTRTYALVGHSMGGYVGLQIAARAVRPPSALVICDMLPEVTPDDLAGFAAAAAKPARRFPSRDEAVQRYRLSPPQHTVPPERLAAVAAQSYRLAPAGAWVEKLDRRALAIGPLAAPELAARLTCPALVVRGEHSEVAPADATDALARAAGATLASMPGLYHHLPLEDPAGLAGLIEGFLRANGL